MNPHAQIDNIVVNIRISIPTESGVNILHSDQALGEIGQPTALREPTPTLLFRPMRYSTPPRRVTSPAAIDSTPPRTHPRTSPRRPPGTPSRTPIRTPPGTPPCGSTDDWSPSRLTRFSPFSLSSLPLSSHSTSFSSESELSRPRSILITSQLLSSSARSNSPIRSSRAPEGRFPSPPASGAFSTPPRASTTPIEISLSPGGASNLDETTRIPPPEPDEGHNDAELSFLEKIRQTDIRNRRRVQEALKGETLFLNRLQTNDDQFLVKIRERERRDKLRAAVPSEEERAAGMNYAFPQYYPIV